MGSDYNLSCILFSIYFTQIKNPDTHMSLQESFWFVQKSWQTTTHPSQMPVALLTARLPSDLLPLCQVHVS